MKIKVEECLGGAVKKVSVQVADGQRWYDFGYMNYRERKEFAEQLRAMVNELMRGPS